MEVLFSSISGSNVENIYQSISLFLACGLSNGHLYILHPLMLKIKARKLAQNDVPPIFLIKFSLDSKFLAYTSTKGRFYLFKMKQSGQPHPFGSTKSHSDDITDILFTVRDKQNICFSLGKDRTIVEYGIADSVATKRVVIERRIEIEQRFIPSCMTICPSNPDHIIITNSNLKLKIVDSIDLSLVGTKQAPQLRTQPNKIKVLNNYSESEYLVFAAGREMGFIKFPLDGNPYKWISLHMGDGPTIDFEIERDGMFMFTLAKSEKNVQMWRVMPSILDILEKQGGKGISPYMKLFEPDKSNLLEKLKDNFFYAQILHQGEYSLEPRDTSNSIHLCEVPDVLRAVGCFLSVFDVQALMQDNELKEADQSKIKKLSFGNFIKLFVNYKDSKFVKKAELKKAFQTLIHMKLSSAKKKLTKEEFINYLIDWGEPFTFCEAFNYLRTLIKPSLVTKKSSKGKKKEEETFDFLPANISFNYFSRVILGLKDDTELSDDSDEEQLMLEEFDKLRQLESDQEMEDDKEDYDLRVMMKKMGER